MSVYRVTEVIGTSTQSWEDAATTAVKTAGKTLRDLRVGEVIAQDLQIDKTGAITFRTKLQISLVRIGQLRRASGRCHGGHSVAVPVDPPALSMHSQVFGRLLHAEETSLTIP
jgi:flavin-binding protein dodecin